MAQAEGWKMTIGKIYIVRVLTTDYVKIGFTAGSVKKRIKSLQNANPMGLSLIRQVEGTRAGEIEFHERFSAKKVRGEWFLFDPQMMVFTPDIDFIEHKPSDDIVPFLNAVKARFRNAEHLRSDLEASGYPVSRKTCASWMSGRTDMPLSEVLEVCRLIGARDMDEAAQLITNGVIIRDMDGAGK
jgi:hypothetical protein